MRPIRKTARYILMRRGNDIRIFNCHTVDNLACSPILSPSTIDVPKFLKMSVNEFNAACRALCTTRINADD